MPFLCVCVCVGGGLCLCHSPDGGVLVHGGVATGCDGIAANHLVSRPRHHGVQRRKTGHTHIHCTTAGTTTTAV